jgi:hypothetical protein
MTDNTNAKNEETLFDSLAECIEFVKEETIPEVSSIKDALLNFSASVRNITDSIYKSSELHKLANMSDVIADDAKKMAAAITKMLKYADNVELTASIKANPMNTDTGSNDEDND